VIEVECVLARPTFPKQVSIGKRFWIDSDTLFRDSSGIELGDFFVTDQTSFSGFRYFSTMRTDHFRAVQGGDMHGRG